MGVQAVERLGGVSVGHVDNTLLPSLGPLVLIYNPPSNSLSLSLSIYIYGCIYVKVYIFSLS